MKTFLKPVAFLILFLIEIKLTAQVEALVLVKDITSSTAANSGPYGFTPFGNKMLFIVDDGIHGREPWITDGTETGTFIIKDIRPGSGNSCPTTVYGNDGYGRYFFRALGNKFVFPATDSINGTELWITDGTALGTYLLKNIANLEESSQPRYFCYFDNKIYFRVLEGNNVFSTWVTDGTEEGTQHFSDIRIEDDYTAIINGKMYFRGDSAGYGTELFVLDGTPEGTHLVKDIAPGPTNSRPEFITAFGDKIIFTADSMDIQNELWISDGTSDGTYMLKDILPGSTSGLPRGYHVFQGKCYFTANSETDDSAELWVTDGTTEGTNIVYEFIEGPQGGDPGEFIEFNGRLWMKGLYASGSAAAYATDGTEAGTELIHEGQFYCAGILNDKLYFMSVNGLFATDGTTTGTYQINGPATNLTPSLLYMLVCGDQLFVTAQFSTTTGYELYRLDAPSAIENKNENQFNIYPNPSSNHIFLTEIETIEKDLELLVTDITGRKVISQIIPTAKEAVSIDINHLNKGLYIITIGNRSRKFVKN